MPGRGAVFSEGGLEGYKKLLGFSSAKVRFEATTHYYYQKVASDQMANVDPDIKLLAMFRHPSDRLYSWFNFNLNHLGALRGGGFLEFVTAILDGDEKYIKKHTRNEEAFRFMMHGIKMGRYVDYLGRWDSYKENLKIIIMEDLTGNERRTMADLSRWLGIDPHYYDSYDFGVSNEAYRTRSKGLHSFSVFVASKIKMEGRLRVLLSKFYWALQKNNSKSEKSYDDKKALAMLDSYYADSIAALAMKIGRSDLPVLWKRDRF